MKRKAIYLFTILFFVTFVSVAGKVHKINDFCTFEGNLKKKIPVGEGTLNIGDLKSKKVSAKITGHFNGNSISDAVLIINKTRFYGNITYIISEHKSKDEISVKLCLENGYLIPVNSFGIKWQDEMANQINVTKEDDASITFLLNKNNQVITVKCAPEFFNYSCKVYPDFINPIEKFIINNQWQAGWNNELKYGIKDTSSQNYNYIFTTDLNLYAEIKQTELINDLVISYKYNEKEYGAYSFQTSILEPYYFTTDKFYIKLSDGSELKRVNYNSFELQLPAGQIYTGNFTNFPQTKSNVWDGLAKVLELTSTTVSFNNGTLTQPDGSFEIIVNGVRKGNELEAKLKSIPGTSTLPNFQDIAKTHLPATKYETEGDKNYEDLRKISKGFLSYIGKPDMDELDLKLYYDSDEYRKDSLAYENLMTQPYYIYEKASKCVFTTTGLSFYPYDFGFGDETYRDELKLGKITERYNVVFFPFKEKYNVWPHNFEFPINNFELLKLLKKRQDHLGILLTFTPGCIIDNAVIVNPTGLYLYDYEEKVILSDVSFALDKYSESVLLERHNKAEKVREAKLK